ncbi:MAG: hypothetical protein H6835_15995 [Planctomycetes bacterium]|nr:hypothetical protein [Planctomycetota bacterium]
MNTPLHPAIVHLPLALAALTPLLGAGLLLAWWRGWLPRRAWWLNVAAHVAMLATGLLAMRSGEGDEEVVEHRVPEAALEAHEHAAELFVQGAGLLCAVVLAVALLRRDPIARGLALVGVAGSCAVLALAIRTGQAGGELVYRHGAAAAFVERAPGPLTAPSLGGSHGAHDDDDAR